MRRATSWLKANLLNILGVIKVVLMGVILVLLINIQVSNARQAQATRQIAVSTKQIAGQINRAVEELKQNNNEQLGRVNAHLDCIVQFFSQPDRSQKAIADINSCQLKSTGSSGAVNQPSAVPKSSQPQKTQQAAPTKPTQSSSQPTDPEQPSFLERLAGGVVSLPRKLIGGMSGLF